MQTPSLAELPAPPPGRTGWPWTDAGDDGLEGRSRLDGPWPRVSIVTPSLNQVDYLEETIRSVLLQGYADLEYIVMDGGSTDGSVEVIRRYEPWLASWTSGSDGGQTQALNVGWKRSTGDILAWINSDDVYLPGAVPAAVRAFDRSPGAGMAYSSAIVVDERGNELRRWDARPFTLEAMLAGGNVVPQPTAFYAREALEAVGYLDERWQMIMDYALSIRVGLRFDATWSPEPGALFRDHAASKSRTRHGRMAAEVIRLLDELEREIEPRADWLQLKARARARVEYEWALACVMDGDPADTDGAADALLHVRRGLRSDPGVVLARPALVPYVIKEVARRRVSRVAIGRTRAPRGTMSRGAGGVSGPRVQLIGRRPDQGITGLSRYTEGLYTGLEAAGCEVHLTFPMRPPVPAQIDRQLKAIGVDLGAFFTSYPLRAAAERADVYHLTDQMLATLLMFQRFPAPVVVTVMDIIPYLVQENPGLNTFRHGVDASFYRLALAALRRADALVVISEYTRQTLIEVLGLPESRIRVIYPAIDHELFRPADVSDSFRERYGLTGGAPYVVYVGSEDPRKNLPTLIRAMARVRETVPGLTLLKVGKAIFSSERRRVRRLIESLHLEDNVRFIGSVPDEDLPSFYNVARACVLPSLYEGFGLPMAEAMACGTPVVHARSGPLPEVAAGAGIEVDARDPDAFAIAILRLLDDPAEYRARADAGIARAASFTWEQAATETRALYAELLQDTGQPRG